MVGNLLKLALGTMVGAVLLRTLLVWIKTDNPEPARTIDDVVGHVPVMRELADYASDYKRANFASDFKGGLELIKVTDHVMVAFGASFVNSIIIDAPEGLIIVDTMESPKTAVSVLRAVREVTKKPIKAIVYTHYHGDHVQGAETFVEDPANPPEIWAYHTLMDIIKGNLVVGRRVGRGIAHQFGVALGRAQLWPHMPNGLQLATLIPPNKLVYNEVESAIVAGLNVTFIHSPGETADHLAVWLPDERVLMPGDNIYRCFPNVYAVRGAPSRDTLVWSASLRTIRSLNADFLVPSHTRPVVGREEVYNTLTVYESAMRFIHDQTVRYMNELRHPDDIAKLVRLPPDLAQHPYLLEFYGMVEWTSRSVYQRYVGWFSGEAVDLQPLTPGDRARLMTDMVGVDRMLDETENALKNSDDQWALELVATVLRVQPGNVRARRLQRETLRSKAARQINPTARNYFLTAALEADGLLNLEFDPSPIIESTDIETVMKNIMTVRLKAELTHGVNLTMIIKLEDTKKIFRLQILHSVLTVDTLPANHAVGDSEVVVTTAERVWKGVMFGKLPAATAYTSGKLKVSGSIDVLKQFLSYF